MANSVYDSDPAAAPDEAFVPGRLHHAVAGNHGRLLDARRTPLSVVGVIPERGELEVRIEAFEDRGAFWRLPVWEISRVQFAPGSARAPDELVADLQRAISRFARALVVEADPRAAEETRGRIEQTRRALRRQLDDLGSVDLAGNIRDRRGDPRLFAALERALADHDLVELDRKFAETMVAYPHSGELVKGHAIVLAELGLCDYRGSVVRDPTLFEAEWTRRRRAQHLIVRLAFAREMWRTVADQRPTLYRAGAVDGRLAARRPESFVSCTFSEPVAAEHFAGGAATHTAVMWRQAVDPNRLLMTFLETAAMNGAYAEAEAILVGDPANHAF